MGKTLAAWLLLSAAAASTATPREVIEAAVQQVIAVLEQPSEGRAKVRPVSRTAPKPDVEIRRIAADLFDFDEVSRRALGRHWAGRTPAEQAEFVTLFTDLLERAYVARIVAYSGERIIYTGSAIQGEHAVVRTRILTRPRPDTALDYRLHRAAGRWKVYDVLIDGVSFVSTYRSEFDRIIQRHSWGELLERLRRKGIEARTVLDHG